MPKSLLKEIRKKKKKTFGKKIITIIIITIIGFLIYNKFFKNTENINITKAKKEQEYIAKKEDIRIAIESNGTIRNIDNLEVGFEINGTINEIYITEGQKIKKGDKIASLDKSSLEYEVQKAQISLDISKANLRAKMIGPDKNDIEIAKRNLKNNEENLKETIESNNFSLRNSEISLELAEKNYKSLLKEIENDVILKKNDLETTELNLEISKSDLEIAKKNLKSNKIEQANKIKQSYQNAISKINLIDIEMRDALYEADKILEINNKTNTYGIKGIIGQKNSQSLINAKNEYIYTKDGYEKFIKKYDNLSEDMSQEEIILAIDESIKVLKKYTELFKWLTMTLNYSGVSDKVSSIQNSISSEESKMKNEINNFITLKQNIETAFINKETTLLSKENTVFSAENKIKTNEQNLKKLIINNEISLSKQEDQIFSTEKQIENAKINLESTKNKIKSSERQDVNQIENAKIQLKAKTEPIKETDILTLNKQIDNAKINLEKAMYNLEQSEIKTPIDGQVIKLNYSVGESFRSDGDPLAIILSENNFEAEVEIEEIDINKIALEQKAIITLDAIENAEFEGIINYISQTGEVDNNGIVTYLVKVKITSRNTFLIKEGMTSYINFIINEANNVVSIPVSAVKNVNGKPSVQIPQGKWIPVSTGFTDGSKVEIISGLKEGEKVLY